MQDLFNRYLMLARRWAWVVVLGVVVCGGFTYIISSLTKPTYQATVLFVVHVDTSSSDVTSSLSAVPTYAQLVTNPLVLSPVVAKHPGMTLKDLTAMIVVKPQVNTQIIELDVLSSDPQLSAQIANEVGQNYLQYANSQLQGRLQMLPAQVPTTPVAPNPLRDTGIGALIGLGLAVTLVVIFEWVEDRLRSPEDAQEVLAQDVLTVIPPMSKRQKPGGKGSAALMEKYRMLAASLNTAQAIKACKVVMVTSAVPGEGKSTVAANLATFLAMTGRAVLLVDANLHRPVLGQRFRIVNSRGLSTVLLEMSGSAPLEVYGEETDISTLRILTSGSVLTGSAELLQSAQARRFFDHLQGAPFDYVLVDAPALLSVADAQILASQVQAVMLVVDASKTPRRVLQRTRRMLDRTRARVLGVALNKSPWRDDAISQQYLEGKAGSREDLPLLMPPAVLSSHPMMLMLPFRPGMGSEGKPVKVVSDEPSDESSDDSLAVTQSLRSVAKPVNGEISVIKTSPLPRQQGKPDSHEAEHGRSSDPKKQA